MNTETNAAPKVRLLTGSGQTRFVLTTITGLLLAGGLLGFRLLTTTPGRWRWYAVILLICIMVASIMLTIVERNIKRGALISLGLIAPPLLVVSITVGIFDVIGIPTDTAAPKPRIETRASQPPANKPVNANK